MCGSFRCFFPAKGGFAGAVGQCRAVGPLGLHPLIDPVGLSSLLTLRGLFLSPQRPLLCRPNWQVVTYDVHILCCCSAQRGHWHGLSHVRTYVHTSVSHNSCCTLTHSLTHGPRSHTPYARTPCHAVHVQYASIDSARQKKNEKAVQWRCHPLPPGRERTNVRACGRAFESKQYSGTGVRAPVTRGNRTRPWRPWT